MQIFEACNFQDLTGQRVANVLATLKFVEEHVARLLTIWHGIEQFTPVALGGQSATTGASSTARSWPAIPAIPSQRDIDSMFRLSPERGESDQARPPDRGETGKRDQGEARGQRQRRGIRGALGDERHHQRRGRLHHQPKVR